MHAYRQFILIAKFFCKFQIAYKDRILSKELVCDYIVKQIDGEYAHLQNLDGSEEDKLVARALLPNGIAEGTKLHYELLQYEIIQ